MTVDVAEVHDRKGFVLLPGKGGHYSMGGMSAVFKADGRKCVESGLCEGADDTVSTTTCSQHQDG